VPVLKGKRPVNILFIDSVVPSAEEIDLVKNALFLINESMLGVFDVLLVP
tara:strand:- start:498 stop:647 length:150 start_codon:yes stop_codon:yes gene_type:complete